MAIRILTLPFYPVSDSFDDGPLSDFLRGKHFQRIDPHFFQQDGCGFWTVLVEYTPVLDDPPVRARDAEVLSDTEQRLFDALRVWRKEAAEKAGVPVYVIATNRQLLDLVKTAPTSRQSLGNIRGFGKKKLQQHGDDIIRIISTFYDQADADSGKPGSDDSADPDPDPDPDPES